MSDSVFPNMHDWTLLSAEFDWSTGMVTLRLQSAAERRVLTARGASSLQVERVHAWGPSVSINSVLVHGSDDGARHVARIEMQSGDIISIEANTFELD
jgi:hypothetical protein